MIRIGTRASPLARIQAQIVADALQQVFPQLTVDIIPIVTHGDKLSTSLAECGGKALFTKELQEALLTNEIDAAVHSLKDVEEHDLPLVFGAFLPRAEGADVLICRKDAPFPQPQIPLQTGTDSTHENAPAFTLGTCSPRRKSQVAATYPMIRCVDLRGNVGTRLNRVAEGAIDATILAAAGLKRLGLLNSDLFEERYPTLTLTPLSKQIFVPAAGQGILAIECLPEKRFLFKGINDPETALIAKIERQVAKAFGGNCRIALGCYVEKNHSGYQLYAYYEGHYENVSLGFLSFDDDNKGDEVKIQAAVDQLLWRLKGCEAVKAG